MNSLLAPGRFIDDDGSADPHLVEVLARFAADRTDLEPVVAALGTTRLLVPVVAVLGQGESEADAEPVAHAGLVGDKNADMALVLLKSPAGQPVLPVFTCLDALRHWNPQARPVPVEARRAALSAVDEGCDIIVIDPAGPVTAVLSRPAVWALAQNRHWVPSPRDPQVVSAVIAAVSDVPGVTHVECQAGRGAELAVVCTLTPGLDRAGLDRVTSAISGRLAALEVVAERVASVELTLR